MVAEQREQRACYIIVAVHNIQRTILQHYNALQLKDNATHCNYVSMQQQISIIVYKQNNNNNLHKYTSHNINKQTL